MTVALAANLLLASLGLIVLGVGLLVLRGRRVATPHCPGCWYDLAATPTGGDGITCPECGRTARSTTELHPRRRRWRAFAVFAALSLMAMAAPWFFGLGGRVYPWLPDPVLAFAYAHTDDGRVRSMLATELINHADYGSPYPDATLRIMTEGAIRRATGPDRARMTEMDMHVLMSARGQFDNPTDSARLAKIGQGLFDHPVGSVRHFGARLAADYHDPASTAGFAIAMAASDDPLVRDSACVALNEQLAWAGPVPDAVDKALCEAMVPLLNDPSVRMTDSNIAYLVARSDDRPHLAAALLALEPHNKRAKRCRAEQLVSLLRGDELEAFARDILLHGDDDEREDFIRELEDLWRDDPARAERAMPGVFARLHQDGTDIRRWFHDAEDFEPEGWEMQLGWPP